MTKLYREKGISNDILLRIMQETYLFDTDKVDILISEAYYRYLNILDYINQRLKDKQGIDEAESLYRLIEEARVYLYFIGYYFCEEFGRRAIERRLNLINIEPLRFYESVDKNINLDVNSRVEAVYLNKIKKFYLVLKYWKQKLPESGKLYLDEDYFDQTKENLLKLFGPIQIKT